MSEPALSMARRASRRASFMLPASTRGSMTSESTPQGRRLSEFQRRDSRASRRPSTAPDTPELGQQHFPRPSTVGFADMADGLMTDRSGVSTRRRHNKSLRRVPTNIREYEGENNDREDLFFGKDYDLFVVQFTPERPLLDRLTPDDVARLENEVKLMRGALSVSASNRIPLDMQGLWQERVNRLEALLYRYYERSKIAQRMSLGTAKARMQDLSTPRKTTAGGRSAPNTTSRSVEKPVAPWP